ncbi:YHS domain-containing (seleno)protein [Roseibium sp.]|uniref:YHS domain-containing (seleno)protein n=1 Tax=Roseibium sp. TaxID=1936156 RepID=UPI003A970F82
MIRSNFIRNGLAAIAVAATLTTSALAAGVDVNATTTGLALRGFDPVTYFNGGAPKAGDFTITAEYKGATYRFTSEANRDAFKADPAKYAPQYGGYCAMGTAMGLKLDGDPHVYKIVDGKLYLNLSKQIAQRWNDDVPGNIKTADTTWTKIEHTAPEDLD